MSTEHLNRYRHFISSVARSAHATMFAGRLSMTSLIRSAFEFAHPGCGHTGSSRIPRSHLSQPSEVVFSLRQKSGRYTPSETRPARLLQSTRSGTRSPRCRRRAPHRLYQGCPSRFARL
jgi:hypothetical protein